MKLLLIMCLLMVGCEFWDDGDAEPVYVSPYKCNIAGSMKCEDNKAYMCSAGEFWETYQDCNAINETCIYNDATVTGGYTGLAVCI